MLLLKAPYPDIQTTIVLPSPDWSNSSLLPASVQVIRSISGAAFVYKKNRQNRRRLQWAFTLSRYKAIELRLFLNSYHGSAIKIIDSYGTNYITYLTSNPLELSSGARAGGFPGDETQQVTLEFEEKI